MIVIVIPLGSCNSNGQGEFIEENPLSVLAYHASMTFRLRTIGLLTSIFLLASEAAVAADTAVVLMYHRFGEDRFPATNIRVEQFRAQLDHLKKEGYSVISIVDLAAAIRDGRSLPDRAAILTIDDAYLSVYEVAYPIFTEYGYPFTVFVSSDPVDKGLSAYMSWEQMREMAAGGASYANHGAGHVSTYKALAGETSDERLARVRGDIEKGWRRIDEELEPLPGLFAFPYGEYDLQSADMLKDMGYISFGQQSGAIGPLSDSRALPRFPIAEAFGDMSQFRTKIASLPMPVTNVEPWDPVTTTRRPMIEISLGPTDARIDEIACFVAGQGRVDVDWLEPKFRFTVGPSKPFNPGRSRVNCTAPRNDGRYLWFSHQWIIPAAIMESP